MIDVRRFETRRCWARLSGHCVCPLAAESISIEMFDEEYFVSTFVVDELVDHVPDDQHAESARTETHLGPAHGGRHHVVGIARRRSVLQHRPA